MAERVLAAAEAGVDPREVDLPGPPLTLVAPTVGDRVLAGGEGVFGAAERDEAGDPLRQQGGALAALTGSDELLLLGVEEVERGLRVALLAQGAGVLAADAGEARPGRVDAREGLPRDVGPLARPPGPVDLGVTGGKILDGADGLRTAARSLAVGVVDQGDGLAQSHVALTAVQDAALQVPVPHEHLDPRETGGLGQSERLGREGVDAIMVIVDGGGGDPPDQVGEPDVAAAPQLGIDVVDPLPDVHGGMSFRA
ncbi:hypothetical protein [Nannocystis pusilla]|uniref:hypothetical protein n=1 Tax=Nannocystis pusilla TaxID=889268 RepID=UPI003B805203